MKQQLLTTYKYYDQKGRRLSIFGELTEDGKYLNMFVLACSTKDFFSKKYARVVYDAYKTGTITNEITYHPYREVIKVESDEIGNLQPIFTFFKFCKNTYLCKEIYLHGVERVRFYKPNVYSLNKVI